MCLEHLPGSSFTWQECRCVFLQSALAADGCRVAPDLGGMMTIEVCGPGCRSKRAGRLHFADGDSHCEFDYTEHLEGLIRRWCRRYPQLGHIEMDRVVLSVAKCRSRSARGLYASVASLAFQDERVSHGTDGCMYSWPRVLKNGREALYLVKFYLPRFHNLSYENKIATILHELYHIHPRFNGEFRCFPGRNWAHGGSRTQFERMFASLKRDILKRSDPFTELFLNCRFRTLVERFGDVYGDRLYLSRSCDRPASLSRRAGC